MAPIGGQLSRFCVPAGQSFGLIVVVAQAPIVNTHAAKKTTLIPALYRELLMVQGPVRHKRRAGNRRLDKPFGRDGGRSFF